MVFMISVSVLVASLVIVIIVPATASTSPTSVSSVTRSVFGKPGVNYRRLTYPSLFYLTFRAQISICVESWKLQDKHDILCIPAKSPYLGQYICC